MIDGRDDEAGIGQRLRGVVMLAEPAAPTVRKDDEGAFRAYGGTVLRPLQVEIRTDRKAAQRHMRRLRCARIPDRACERGIGLEKLNARGMRRRDETAENNGESPKRIAQRNVPLISRRS